MKIFVAFGYQERDRWIKELVFPSRSFDGEVISGEEIQGAELGDGIKLKIGESDVVCNSYTER